MDLLFLLNLEIVLKSPIQ